MVGSNPVIFVGSLTARVALSFHEGLPQVVDVQIWPSSIKMEEGQYYVDLELTDPDDRFSFDRSGASTLIRVTRCGDEIGKLIVQTGIHYGTPRRITMRSDLFASLLSPSRLLSILAIMIIPPKSQIKQ